VALDSSWARITAVPVPGCDDYEVEGADGKTQLVHRRELRHRRTVSEAHVGITADPKHDSYSMRSFVGSFLKDLRGRGVIAAQGLRVLAVHSDNAAQVCTRSALDVPILLQELTLPACFVPPAPSSQHFKSSKTLKWFSELRRLSGEPEPEEGEIPKFDSVMYDFGPPGHGKGYVHFVFICAWPLSP
jgi:hypothetical protein